MSSNFNYTKRLLKPDLNNLQNIKVSATENTYDIF